MPSRAERRAYERMTKNQDPRALPVNPAHKARADRIAQRRAVAKAAAPQRASRTYWIRAIVAALLLGLTAFSVAWDGGDGMPLALYIGIGAVAVVLVAAVALRSVLARAADAARSRGATPRR